MRPGLAPATLPHMPCSQGSPCDLEPVSGHGVMEAHLSKPAAVVISIKDGDAAVVCA